MKTQAEAPGKIGGPGVRARSKNFKWVCSPEGEVTKVEDHVATDLVNIRGYSYTHAPKADEAKAVEAGPEGEDTDDGEGNTTPTPPKAKTPNPALEAYQKLRAEAVALGIEVKQGMGTKKLTEAIEAAKLAKSGE